MSYGLVLIRLINEANFFVAFIALIVTFFLLGLIIGNVMNRPKKDPKDSVSKKALEKAAKEKPKEADAAKQEEPENAETQEPGQDLHPRNSGYRYYNWW